MPADKKMSKVYDPSKNKNRLLELTTTQTAPFRSLFEILKDIDDNSQDIKQYKGPIPLKRIK